MGNYIINLGASISASALSAQDSTGDVPVTFTGLSGRVWFILTDTNPATTPPTEAQIRSGLKHNDSAAPASGVTNIVAGTPQNVAIPSGLNGSYYFVATDGTGVVYDGTPETFDTVAPLFSSAEVGNVDASSLIVTYDDSLGGSSTGSDWSVLVDGVNDSVTAASISGTTIDLTLATAVDSAGAGVTVQYSGSTIKDTSGNFLAAHGPDSVQNNVVT